MHMRLIFPRILIAAVLFFNLQCALAFLLRPAAYMGGFGLAGVVGEQMVRALGVLFLMWNVPYIFALIDPQRRRFSLLEAIIMQAVGLLGETGILLLGGPYPARITATITRFILFDGGGLILLVAALVLVRQAEKAARSAS